MTNREKLMIKQDGKCAMCKAELHMNKSNCYDNFYLQIDHIYPVSLGGKSHIDNYRGLCKSCNSSKRNMSGDKLVSMLMRKAKDADLEKYSIRIKDDLDTGNIAMDRLIEVVEELEKSYRNSMELLKSINH